MINRLNNHGDENAIAIGEGAVAVVGDVHFVLHPVGKLTPSLAEKLLREFVRIELPADTELSLELPAPIMEKLNYNNAPVFQSIFNNHQDDFLALEQAMRNFPDSSRVVKRVCDLFYSTREANRNPSGHYSGDIVLQKMRETLCNEIVAGNHAEDGKTIYVEAVDGFCIALLEWCVMDCKILEKPSTGFEGRHEC